MSGRVRIGARREPYVVRALGAAGEDLLAIDDEGFPVAHRPGLQRREVGARLRLTVADGEVELTAGDARQDIALLLRRAAPDQGRTDGVDGHERKRRLGKPQFLKNDLLGQGIEPATAVLLGPAGGQPAVLAHAPEEAAVGAAAL